MNSRDLSISTSQVLGLQKVSCLYMGAGELNSAACSYIAVTLMTEPFPHPLLSLRQSLSLYLELTDLPRQSVSWRTPVSPPSTVLCFV